MDRTKLHWNLHAWRNIDASEVGAATEQAQTDSGQAWWQNDLGQASAPLERCFSDAGDRSRDVNLCNLGVSDEVIGQLLYLVADGDRLDVCRGHTATIAAITGVPFQMLQCVTSIEGI